MVGATSKPTGFRQSFLLDSSPRRAIHYAPLKPDVATTPDEIARCLARSNSDSLWVCQSAALTSALARLLRGPVRNLGRVVLLHSVDPLLLPALSGSFRRLAFAAPQQFLPPSELAETLSARHAADLVIGGLVDPSRKTMTLWRGNLDPLVVPFSAFPVSGDGTRPDFESFSVTDYGQTIRLGAYEAAVEAILYEYDPDYRRRMTATRWATEQTFGASLRRLRKQRGLRREDFVPNVTAKTIARIERDEVRSVQPGTLAAIADRLGVRPDEIGSF